MSMPFRADKKKRRQLTRSPQQRRAVRQESSPQSATAYMSVVTNILKETKESWKRQERLNII